ncbi:MAG: choice-of-anchor J domain-containing protein [Bryobacteraceae bacterium]
MYKRLGVILSVLSLPSLNAAILTEGFDDVPGLTGMGWVIVNNSSPLGTTDWFQGNAAIFPAESGAPDSYAATNYLAAGLGGNVSVWLLTPEISIANGDTIMFYTQHADNGFEDRLEVRLSTNGASTDVGATDASVGDFTTLLLTVNPLLDGSYPDTWTLFSATVSGVAPGVTGRYAFRSVVPDTDNNGDYLGIDTLSIDGGRLSGVPEPGTSALALLGLSLVALRKRRTVRS